MLKEKSATLIRLVARLTMMLAATMALVVTAARPGAARSKYSLEIRNGSQYDIYDVRMSSSSAGLWGPDLLGPSRILGSESTFTITDVVPGFYDVRLEEQDHDVCVVKNIPFFSDKTWDLTTAGLLECEGY